MNKKAHLVGGLCLLFLVSAIGAGWINQVSAAPLLNVRLIAPWDGFDYSNSVALEFSYVGTGFFGVVKQPTCYIYLDGQRIELERIDQNVSLGQEYNMSKTVVRSKVLNLTEGDHYLSVGVDVWYNHTLVSVYNPRLGYNDWVARENYTYGHSEVVHFTVANPTPTPTASPSSSPTPSASPSPIPETTPSPSVPEFPAWTALPVAALAAVMIVCFRKHKKS